MLGLVAVAAILWSGRNTFWADTATPRREIPAQLLQIDINRAEAREFALLPGVGPVLAKRIVADRRQNGLYVSVEDLTRVHGIGQKTIQRISAYCLPVDRPDAQIALAGE